MNEWKINLSLFNEGGEGDAAPVATGQSTETTPVVKYGKQDKAEQVVEAQEETVERPAFKDLIEGDYKEDFTTFFQEKFNERHRNHKDLEAKVTNYEGILGLVGQKYGISEIDADKLLKAIEDDESYYEEEAMEKGMSVEQLRDYKRLERERNVLMTEKAQREKDQQVAQIQQRWASEESQLKQVYPEFDFRQEIQNPKFVGLITNNIDLRTAFEVVHRAELLDGAVRQTAGAVKKAVTQDIKAKGIRPNEEGAGGTARTEFRDDPKKWSPEEFAEVARRVARGEKIKL